MSPIIGSFGSGGGFGRRGGRAAGLYEFTNATFTAGGQTGRTGPSLSQARNGLSGPETNDWKNNTEFFTQGAFQGYQRWTVPANGTYKIEAGGAAGGKDLNTAAARAYGAVVSGDFVLTEGQQLDIVVGSKGNEYSSPHYNEAGGGGGTFVKNHSANSLLLVAGGAGGAPSSVYGTSCSRPISQGHGQTTQSGAVVSCASTPSTPSLGNGGNTAGTYQGGAGGGYNSNGANGGAHCATSIGGQGFNNGCVGGTGNTCYSSNTQNAGGFGGGGGGQLSGPGGGGGYTGGSCSGSWSSFSAYGGGGGSYNVGSNASASSGTNTGSTGGYQGAGWCKITRLS